MSKRFTKLTHANLLVPIGVDLELLAAWYFAANNKCTHIMLSGGAMLPVSEGPEIILERKEAYALEQNSRGGQ